MRFSLQKRLCIKKVNKNQIYIFIIIMKKGLLLVLLSLLFVVSGCNTQSKTVIHSVNNGELELLYPLKTEENQSYIRNGEEVREWWWWDHVWWPLDECESYQTGRRIRNEKNQEWVSEWASDC